MEVSWPWPRSDREALIYLYKIPKYNFMNSRWPWQLLNFWMLFFALATSLQNKSSLKTPGFFLDNLSSFQYTLYNTETAPGHRSLRQADIHHRFQFKAKLLTEIFPGEPARQVTRFSVDSIKRSSHHLFIAEFPTHLHHKWRRSSFQGAAPTWKQSNIPSRYSIDPKM